MRLAVIISLIATLFAGNAIAQIACPAMGLTQVNVNKKNKLSGFSSAVRKGKKKTRMGNFFTAKKKHSSGFSCKDPFAFKSKKSKSGFSGKDPFAVKSKKTKSTNEYSEFSRKASRRNMFRDYDEFARKRSGRNRYNDKDEFASRSKKKGRFRSSDEFATRSTRSKKFRDFDEFAYRNSRGSRFSNSDEFATRSKRTKRVNVDSQFAVRSTAKRFNSGKKQKSEFKSKKKRAKANRSEYTPFASTTNPGGAQKTHRSPQIGLWGGTVGRRSGKDKRASQALPDPAKKDD
ncbi:MAG: hypothetical protein ACPGU4_00975 [Flavobacteriales bacterium]